MFCIDLYAAGSVKEFLDEVLSTFELKMKNNLYESFQQNK